MREIRLRCQRLLPNRRQCRLSTFGDGGLCRWHRIGDEFRADFRAGGRFVAQIYMLAVAAGVGLTLQLLRVWERTDEPVALALAALIASGTAVAFADALLAIDGPLSTPLLWPRLLAAGMLANVVAGIAVAAAAAARPQPALRLVREMGIRGMSDPLVVPVLASLAIVSTAPMVMLFVRRILFLQPPWLGTMVGLLTVSTCTALFLPLLRQNGLALTPAQSKSFWAPALGTSPEWALTVVWLVGFVAAERANVRLRLAMCSPDHFRRTIWPSYPVCLSSPILAMLGARLAVTAVGRGGAVLFGVLTLLLTGPICRIFTVMVVRQTPTGEDEAAEGIPDPDEARPGWSPAGRR